MSEIQQTPPPKQLEDFKNILEDLKDRTSESKAIANDLKKQAQDLDLGAGLSFLQVKNGVMLDYLSNLTLIMLRKCSGKSINGQEAIERIVEDRTVLEKMKPIEKKLKYQIDKALKVVESGQLSTDDPMNFKPNLSGLKDTAKDSDDSEDDSEDEEEETNQKMTKKSNSSGKYIPPKNVPAFTDDAETLEKMQEERVKKRSLSKSLVEDLRRQHLDLPEEEHSHVDTMRAQQIAKMKERIRYEEENFTRLPLSKKDKHKRRQMTTMGTLGDELTYFGENNFFSEKSSGSKKRKSSKKFSKGAARKKFKRK